jgi:hypothetical protein
LVVGFLACLGVAADLACSDGSAFQPITYGAQPWTPPAGWGEPGNPNQCTVGEFIAVDGPTCKGCTNIAYALCVGTHFSQCVCGGPFWSGAACPFNLVCGENDFPPVGWSELSGYSGPGWAGMEAGAPDSTMGTPTPDSAAAGGSGGAGGG